MKATTRHLGEVGAADATRAASTHAACAVLSATVVVDLLVPRVAGPAQLPWDVGLALVLHLNWLLLVLGLSGLAGPRIRPPLLAAIAAVPAAVEALVIGLASIWYPIRDAPGADGTLVAVAVVGGAVLLLPAIVAEWRPRRAGIGVVVPVVVLVVGIWASGPGVPVLPSLGLALACGVALLGTRPARGLLAVAVAALVAMASRPLPDPVSAADRPDVVLVVVDTLRGDAAAAMKSVRRIAADGVSVEGWATGSWTLPSTASLMTGAPVHAHGAIEDETGRHGIRLDVRTLAETLRDRGWQTLAVVSENPNISASLGFARGFDLYDQLGDELYPHAVPVDRIDRFARPPSTTALRYALLGLGRSHLTHALGLAERSDGHELVWRALSVWRARDPDRPALLLVHLLEPHLPYRHADDLGLTDAESLELEHLARPTVLLDDTWRTRRDRLRAAYDNEVAHADRAITTLLDGLGPPGPAGRIVVLTSDHGEELWEHGGFEHGHSLYEELLQVPLVVGGLAPEHSLRRRAGPIGLAEVPCIVLEAVGDPPCVPNEVLVAQNLLYWSESPDRSPLDWAARRGSMKLLHDGRLFDLAADPSESAPVVDPVAESALRAAAPSAFATGDVHESDPEEREVLRALGYLE